MIQRNQIRSHLTCIILHQPAYTQGIQYIAILATDHSTNLGLHICNQPRVNLPLR
uniref:Uncharacterized protein n=1 Tax=Anguilla anguilla TaxID=7936 RepID=A0A0E9PQK3_ANGAN